jgi:hypothetical protein
MTAKKTDARRNLSRATTRKFIAGRHLPTREPTPAEEPCKGAAGSKARLLRVRFQHYLNARVTPDRHQIAAFTSDKSVRQRKVNDCEYVVLAASVLGDPHSPNENSTLRFGHHPGKFSHSVPRNAAARFQFLPRGSVQASEAIFLEEKTQFLLHTPKGSGIYASPFNRGVEQSGSSSGS